MSTVRRIYVEKKPGFDVEAQGLFQDMKQNLRLEGLTGVRVLNRYDIDHIQDGIYEQAKYTVFAEAAIDTLYEEVLEYGTLPTYLGEVPTKETTPKSSNF